MSLDWLGLLMDDVSPAQFDDRPGAGRLLASALRRFLHDQDPVLLAIPTGGVPVAASIARELALPLDLIVSRRIIAPDGLGISGEDSLGAITPDRALVVNSQLVACVGLTIQQVEQLSIPVWAEAQRRLQLYRRGRPYPDLRGKTAVIIDDGLTTGYTMMAAVISARKLEPERVIVAVPVAAVESLERLSSYVDELLALTISSADPFAVSSYYRYYPPLGDEDVIWTMDPFWNQHPPQGYSETF